MREQNTAPPECMSIMRLCVSFLDEELDPGEAAEVQTHLSACARCRGYIERERSFSAMMKENLSPAVGVSTSRLEQRVITALREAEAPVAPRIWPRLLAAAALLLLGAFIGSVATLAFRNQQPAATRMDAELAAQLDACCGLAAEVLPDTRFLGGYEQAAAEYQRAFAGPLPHIKADGAPEPRLFGTTQMGGADVSWVVYCTGAGTAPDFTERFVLLTMDGTSMENALTGLQQLEVSAHDMRLLAWRDGDYFRVLITRREAQWARAQRDALAA